MNPIVQRALILVQQSRYEPAENELRQFLMENPNDSFAHSVLAICQVKQKKYNEASESAATAIGLAPDFPFSYYAQSLVDTERNRFKEAERSIAQAIELDPFKTIFFSHQAVIFLNQKKWKEALAAAEKGLEIDPEDVDCTNLRATALMKLGHRADAGEAIESALQQDPTDHFSHANLGWSLLESGDPNKAMEHFREALRLQPNNEWARTGIVEAMKARNFLYRWILGYFMWIGKLASQSQWYFIIGMYAGYLILNRLANNVPAVAPYIRPILIAYIAFALTTWLASPLFNLILRLDKFGRLALSPEEIKTSNWIGLSVLLSLSMLVTYFLLNSNGSEHAFHFLGLALMAGLFIPPLSTYYGCDEGWPRTANLILILVMAAIALVEVLLYLYAVTGEGPSQNLAMGLSSFCFLAFVLLGVFSQFLVNFLVSARPQR